MKPVVNDTMILSLKTVLIGYTMIPSIKTVAHDTIIQSLNTVANDTKIQSVKTVANESMIPKIDNMMLISVTNDTMITS